MFHKIVVGADGSASARDAAQIAAGIAAHFHAKALIVNIFDPSYLVAPAEWGVWGLAVGDGVMEDCAKSQRVIVERQIKPLFAVRGERCEVIQEMGHPVNGIVDVARREQADLVIVGSRGLSGVKEFFLGSVSNGVLHYAPCPVLIARGENLPDPNDGFRHILLATDGSDGAKKATEIAVAMAQQFATSLTVLNVFEPFQSAFADIDDDSPEDSIGSLDPERYAAHQLETIRERTLEIARKAGVYCDVKQEYGDSADTIVRVAGEQRSDLIVIGSRGMGGFKELLLGSVSNCVAHHAPCPVLVAR